MFALTADIPQDWRELWLGVTAVGYEPARVYVSSSTTDAVLRVFRSLTIRPGASIEMRVFLGHSVCGYESHLCRRVLVQSSTGEPIDLEAIPADSQRHVGLFAGPEANHPFSVTSYPRRVTVSDGEVWIYAGAEPTNVYGVFEQKLTLIAHPH